jgi:hypothetical protein
MIRSRKILIPTTELAANRDTFEVNLIKELCGVSPKEWSSRENRLMSSALVHGELYEMVIEEYETYDRFQTDLGDSESLIFVQVPKGLDQNKVAELVQRLAEGLV